MNIYSILIRYICVFRKQTDGKKIKRIPFKSGQSSQEVEEFDIYKNSWEFFDHMMFYIPPSVRKYRTKSLGGTTEQIELIDDMSVSSIGTESSSVATTSAAATTSKKIKDPDVEAVSEMAKELTNLIRARSEQKEQQSKESTLKYQSCYVTVDAILSKMDDETGFETSMKVINFAQQEYAAFKNKNNNSNKD